MHVTRIRVLYIMCTPFHKTYVELNVVTRRHRRPAGSDASGARSLQVLRAARERGPDR